MRSPLEIDPVPTGMKGSLRAHLVFALEDATSRGFVVAVEKFPLEDPNIADLPQVVDPGG